LARRGAWNQAAATGLAAIVRDSSAPLSGPTVAQFNYPIGFRSGIAPSSLYFNDTPAGREYYTGFWWKASSPWQRDPSGINKITFWQDAAPSNANLIVMMNNQRHPKYVLTVTLELRYAEFHPVHVFPDLGRKQRGGQDRSGLLPRRSRAHQ
jgi:hypothetical protein